MKTKMQLVMNVAWKIRKDEAVASAMKVSEIHFGTCLKMAWAKLKKYGHTTVEQVHMLTMIDPFADTSFVKAALRVEDIMDEDAPIEPIWLKKLDIAFNYHF